MSYELVLVKLGFIPFSAREHDLNTYKLNVDSSTCGATGYYRQRPLVLSLGLDVVDAVDVVASPMAKYGGFSYSRYIGLVCNYPNVKR